MFLKLFNFVPENVDVLVINLYNFYLAGILMH